MSKYQRWYDALIDSAKSRETPTTYSELHHIKPRSLGGSDAPSNLVRLTYREHFLAHWLLSKICVGDELRPMQRALLAMTFLGKGERIVAGWQFEVAKRAVRDIQLDAMAKAAAALAEENAQRLERARYEAKLAAQRREVHEQSKAFLEQESRRRRQPNTGQPRGFYLNKHLGRMKTRRAEERRKKAASKEHRADAMAHLERLGLRVK